MAQVRSEIAKIVERYRDQLAAMGIRAERVFLFGSHARGEPREGSDIDLIVVSPDFREKNLRERAELLGVAAARILEPIQALGVTPEEVAARPRAPFLDEVLTHGALPIS